MKKLTKKLGNSAYTIEAYGCLCTCDCTCENCYCFCIQGAPSSSITYNPSGVSYDKLHIELSGSSYNVGRYNK